MQEQRKRHYIPEQTWRPRQSAVTEKKNVGKAMKKLFWLKIALSGRLVLLMAYPVGADDTTVYADPKVRDLVVFVEAAAAAIRHEGEKVFPDFRREGGHPIFPLSSRKKRKNKF
jgi:hypothetical protein